MGPLLAAAAAVVVVVFRHHDTIGGREAEVTRVQGYGQRGAIPKEGLDEVPPRGTPMGAALHGDGDGEGLLDDDFAPGSKGVAT